MSIEVMTHVWKRFPGSGSELIAFLALADWCNDEGGSLHPSIAALAAKMRVSESQARRVLHGLIKQGYVSVVGNENGGAPGTTRRYQINLDKLREHEEIKAKPAQTGSTSARGSVDARGSMGARDGSHGCAETGSTHDTLTVNRTVIEPLSINKARKKKVEIPDWLDADVWNDFVAMRKEIKKPMTARATELMLAKLQGFHESGLDVTAMLENSILNCWQDVYEPRAMKTAPGTARAMETTKRRKYVGTQEADIDWLHK